MAPMTTGLSAEVIKCLEQMEQDDDERCRRDGVPTRAERAKWKVVWGKFDEQGNFTPTELRQKDECKDCI